jgi:hypothetical protein
MKAKENPVVLIVYPQEFFCFEKFERKVSKILKNLNCFSVVFEADPSGFIKRYLSSNVSIHYDELVGYEKYLNKISHAIIFNHRTEFADLIDKVKRTNIKARIINLELTIVVNVDHGEKYDEYIGRGAPWGNPHAVGFGASIGEEQNDRSEAIRKYKYDFEKDFLRRSKKEHLKLKGKILGCHCRPEACHGDVIAEYLNALDDGK